MDTHLNIVCASRPVRIPSLQVWLNIAKCSIPTCRAHTSHILTPSLLSGAIRKGNWKNHKVAYTVQCRCTTSVAVFFSLLEDNFGYIFDLYQSFQKKEKERLKLHRISPPTWHDWKKGDLERCSQANGPMISDMKVLATILRHEIHPSLVSDCPASSMSHEHALLLWGSSAAVC